jgi:hypothetical protein
MNSGHFHIWHMYNLLLSWFKIKVIPRYNNTMRMLKMRIFGSPGKWLW